MSNDLSHYFENDIATIRRTLDKDVAKLVNIINDAYSYQDEIKGAMLWRYLLNL